MAKITQWAGQAVRHSGWNMSLRSALVALALVGGLALLAAFYLAISSQTAVLGRRLQDLEADRAGLVGENAYLRDRIARDASFARLQQRAFALNYVTTGTVLFVPVDLPAVPESEALSSP